MSVFRVILIVLGASQLYWGWRGYSLATRLITAWSCRLIISGVVLCGYLCLFAFNLGLLRRDATPVHLTLSEALLAAPLLWWIASSLVAFLVVILFAIPTSLVGITRRIFVKSGARSAGDAIDRRRAVIFWSELPTSRPPRPSLLALTVCCTEGSTSKRPCQSASPACPSLRGISYLPTFRHPRRALHARGRDP
jgi:hypothetical protein